MATNQETENEDEEEYTKVFIKLRPFCIEVIHDVNKNMRSMSWGSEIVCAIDVIYNHFASVSLKICGG